MSCGVPKHKLFISSWCILIFMADDLCHIIIIILIMFIWAMARTIINFSNYIKRVARQWPNTACTQLVWLRDLAHAQSCKGELPCMGAQC